MVLKKQAKLKKHLNKKSTARRKHQTAKKKLAAATLQPPRNDLVPDLAAQKIPIAELKSPQRETRAVEPDQLERIMRSIQSFGIVVPILIDRDNRIVAGNTIVAAATLLGVEEIWVVRVDHLDEVECRLLHTTLNRLGETGDWNIAELRLELLELEDAGLDLAVTGFSIPELDIILQDDDELEEDAEVFEVSDHAVSEIGDLWQLGDHRLICGDARDEAVYQTLMAGDKAAAVFEDSPYNIAIPGTVSGLGKVKHDNFVMGCGEMSDTEFREFLAAFLARCRDHVAPGAVLFACIDWRQHHLLRLAGADAGLTHINTAIWYKESGGMGALYRSAHELIVILCNGKMPATNNVELGRHGRDRTNVWTYPGANKPGSSAAEALHLHATPKPVELVEDALLDVTERGDIVLDPFIGSGTTIIAAERSGRKARGIELDPTFVDVTIRRWQALTGRSALYVETGQSFDERNELALKHEAEADVQSIAQTEGGAQ